MMGSSRTDELVNRQRQSARLRPFLQRRLWVTRRTFHLGNQWFPEAVDKAGGRLEAAVEIYRRDQGFAGIGEDAGVRSRPHGRLGARQDEIVFKLYRRSDTGERFAPHQVGQPAG